MQHRNRIWNFFPLVILVFLISCAESADKSKTIELDERIDPSSALAVVNDWAITESLVSAYMKHQAPGQNLAQLQQHKDRFVDSLVNLALLAQAAENAGLDQTAEVYNSVKLQKYHVLAQSAIEDMLQKDPITDQQIESYYTEKFATEKSEYKTRHILVETEAEAKQLIDRLNQGEKFAQLAEKHSKGPSAGEGGALEWFVAEDVDPAFAEAVQQLEKGTYSKTPIHTQYGWHVVLLEDARKVAPPDLKEIREKIEKILQEQKIQSYIEQLKSKAKINHP